MANSDATKNPLAATRAAMPARRHRMSKRECSMNRSLPARRPLRFAVREEVRVDEVVDDVLAGGIHFLELHAHPDAAVAPRHTALRVDFALGSGQAEPYAHRRVVIERTGGPDREPTPADVQGERGS